jgi:hypothetical protein
MARDGPRQLPWLLLGVLSLACRILGGKMSCRTAVLVPRVHVDVVGLGLGRGLVTTSAQGECIRRWARFEVSYTPFITYQAMWSICCSALSPIRADVSCCPTVPATAAAEGSRRTHLPLDRGQVLTLLQTPTIMSEEHSTTISRGLDCINLQNYLDTNDAVLARIQG